MLMFNDLSLTLLLYRYNNMANPDWGSVDWRLARVTPAHYEDGVYMMAEKNRSHFTPHTSSNLTDCTNHLNYFCPGRHRVN